MKTTFPTRWRNEDDDWSSDGAAITAEESLRAIQMAFERGPIIVEHGHYRGGRAPTRAVFDDWDAFESYVQSEAVAGDTVDVWSFGEVCSPERRIAEGKCPAEDGRFPKRGAY